MSLDKILAGGHGDWNDLNDEEEAASEEGPLSQSSDKHEVASSSSVGTEEDPPRGRRKLDATESGTDHASVEKPVEKWPHDGFDELQHDDPMKKKATPQRRTY